MVARTKLSSIVFELAFAGCAGDADDDWESRAATSPIYNGNSVSSENETGFLALTRYPDQHIFCSAILMTNTKALTAKHCLAGDPEPWSKYIKMGTQYAWVVDEALKSDEDVAMIKLYPPLTMSGSSTGFSRPIYAGTNQYLDGEYLACFGHGPGGVGAPLRWALFPTAYVIASPVPLRGRIQSAG